MPAPVLSTCHCVSEGGLALKYFAIVAAAGRGNNPAVSAECAPAGWKLYRYLVNKKRYSVQPVEQAGLNSTA